MSSPLLGSGAVPAGGRQDGLADKVVLDGVLPAVRKVGLQK